MLKRQSSCFVFARVPRLACRTSFVESSSAAGYFLRSPIYLRLCCFFSSLPLSSHSWYAPRMLDEGDTADRCGFFFIFRFLARLQSSGPEIPHVYFLLLSYSPPFFINFHLAAVSGIQELSYQRQGLLSVDAPL